jgi:putative ABC transport system permease protein
MKRVFRTGDYHRDPGRDISEEIDTHLDLKIEELVAAGLPEEEARAEAVRRFGNRAEIHAEATGHARKRERRQSLFASAETLLQDGRYALRTLSRAPGMTILTILILALGIGANTAIFSVLQAVFLEPLPLPHPEELTFIWNRNIRNGGRGPSSFPNYLDWRDQNATFQAMGAFEGGNLNLTDGDEPIRIRAAMVTASVFDVLAVQPARGRVFLPEEDLSMTRAVILSHQLWTERYGGDPSLIGQTIQVDGGPRTVIGIMPQGFEHPTPWGMGDPYLAWIPLEEDQWIRNRNSFSYQVLARLRPGVQVETAQEDMNQLGARLEEEFPDSNTDNRPWVVPLHSLLFGEAGFQITVVLLAAAVVLLIACGNVAAFLLSRAASRQTEMAVRAALGAGRRRIVRQLLTESTVLALGGGLGAILLARWSLDALRSFIPPTIPRTGEIHLDGGALLFALLLSLLTGLIFGLAPAVSASRTDLAGSLKGGVGLGGGGRRRWDLQHVFVVGQFALGLILANTGLLLLQSYASLQETDQGFDGEHVLTLGLSLGGDRYDESTERQAFFQQLVPRLRSLPGVRDAGATSKLPLMGGTNGPVFTDAMIADRSPEDGILTEVSAVEGAYFAAMGIPLLAGRTLAPDDDDPQNPGVVINEAAAYRFWPDEDPLGRRFSFGNDPPQWLTVVGVVGDVRQWGPEIRPQPEAYLRYSQNPRTRMFLSLSSAGDPRDLIRPARAAVLSVDPNQPVSEIRTMGEIVGSQLAGREFYTLLIGLFSLLALGLAAAGVYGVISYFVAQRTRELGIRVAVGAGHARLMGLVFRRAFLLAIAGVALGLVGAVVATLVISSLLYGVSPLDPPTLAGGVGLLLVVGLTGALLPGLRATRLSPVEALRSE